MAWTTTSNFAVGHVVTAAEWNQSLGASGNTQFLKDALSTLSQNSVSASKSLNAVYQNTSGRIVIESVWFVTAVQDAVLLRALTGSTNPPVLVISQERGIGAATGVGTYVSDYRTLIFPVPPNFYYSVSTAGTPTSSGWTEIVFAVT